MNTAFRTALVALSVALLAAHAYARNLSVPEDFATIQAAVDAAKAGDTITIGAGTYTESVTILGKSRLLIRGQEGAELSALDDEDTSLIRIQIVDSSRITLRDLRVVEETQTRTGVLVTNSSRVLIKDCEVVKCGAGIRVAASQRIRVQSNYLDECLGGVILAGNETGVDLKKCIVKANTINQGAVVGIQVDGEQNRAISNAIAGGGSEDTPGSAGILVRGARNRVWNNLIGLVEHRGMQVEGDEHRIIKNEIDQTGDIGMFVDGSNHEVKKNKIDRAGDDALFLEGEFHTVSGNEISDCAQDGIDIEADSCVVSNNTISDPGDDGLSVDATEGSVIKKNTVTGAMGDGVRLASNGNTLIGNSATGSDSLDLRLVNGASAEENNLRNNTWPENNL